MIVYKTLQSFPFFLIKFLDLFTYKIFLKVFTLKLLLKFTPIDEYLQKNYFIHISMTAFYARQN